LTGQVYPIGVPALFFFLLYRKVSRHFLLLRLGSYSTWLCSLSSQRTELRSPEVLQSLGFLFDAYSRPAYLFEVRADA
jgi:hypothetical protein